MKNWWFILFTSKQKKPILKNGVKVNFRRIYDEKKTISIEAIETAYIIETVNHSSTKNVQEFCNEANIQIADIEVSLNWKVSLLVESDCYCKITSGKIKIMQAVL